jgi:hypothetical protein
VNIKSISNNPLFINQPKDKKVENSQAQDVKDKIEISNAGRSIAASELSPQRLEEIRSRIDSKFYSTDEVYNKVAEKILGELNK